MALHFAASSISSIFVVFYMEGLPQHIQVHGVLPLIGLTCPGTDAVSVSPLLADLLDTLNLCQHVNVPTRMNPDHLLDVIVTDPELQVRDVRVDAAGEISDHHLVVARLCVDTGVVRRPVPISWTKWRPFVAVSDVRRKLQRNGCRPKLWKPKSYFRNENENENYYKRKNENEKSGANHTAILCQPAVAQQCEHNLASSSWTEK